MGEKHMAKDTWLQRHMAKTHGPRFRKRRDAIPRVLSTPNPPRRDGTASGIVGGGEPMSRGESDRRPSDAAPSPEPIETRPEPTAPEAETPGALRRIGGGIGAWWRRVGGVRGLLAPVADGARWLYRNRGRIASGVRRFGEVLVAILKTAARVGAVLVRMGEALARLEEQRAAKPVGPGRKRAARAGAGLSRLGRRLDDFGRGLLPVADGIEDIGEHLESAAPGDSAPLPPALPDPAPSAAPAPAPERTPAPAPPKDRPAAPGPASSPPATPDAETAAEPDAPQPPAPQSPADRRPSPIPESVTAASETPPAPVADDPAAALPEELRARLRGLGRRPARATLETLIEDICRARGWSTTADLAAILDRDSRSLNRTYLKPMADAGRLLRRYPDQPRHPDQAFAAAK